MPFMDLIKKAIFEEEPQAAQQSAKPSPGPAATRPRDPAPVYVPVGTRDNQFYARLDRKSTRLNSSHGYISYAVFCLKKKKNLYTECLLHLTNPRSTAPTYTHIWHHSARLG